MSALETLSLASIAIGAVAMLRFIWLDSLRFSDVGRPETQDGRVSSATAHRLALQADAARVRAENADLPRAA